MQDGFGVLIKWLLIALAAVICLYFIALRLLRGRGAPESGKNAGSGAGKALLDGFPGLEAAFVWLDARLMQAGKRRVLVSIKQEWCCEDREGKTDRPIRTRPSMLECRVGNEVSQYALDLYSKKEYMSGEEVRLLQSEIVSRCRRFAPYRRYRVYTHRVTRSFEIPDGFSPEWEETVIVKEEFDTEID